MPPEANFMSFDGPPSGYRRRRRLGEHRVEDAEDDGPVLHRQRFILPPELVPPEQLVVRRYRVTPFYFSIPAHLRLKLIDAVNERFATNYNVKQCYFSVIFEDGDLSDLVKFYIGLFYDHPDILRIFRRFLPFGYDIFVNENLQYVYIDGDRGASIVPRRELLEGWERFPQNQNLSNIRARIGPEMFFRVLCYGCNAERRGFRFEAMPVIIEWLFDHPDLVYHYIYYMLPEAKIKTNSHGDYVYRSFSGTRHVISKPEPGQENQSRFPRMIYYEPPEYQESD
ncbi:unnamed protein product [Caenorhabditis sp. 36 PRJEB53466]|nr:unnamed protein product [Caenorhabditis sp. 36 PRJEB53466]